MINYINYMEGTFNSRWISKFINQWFFLGKQQKIERLLYASFFIIKKKLKLSPIFFFFEALEKLKPVIGLKLYRKKQRKIIKVNAVPYLLEVPLRYKKAIRWLAQAIKMQTSGSLKFNIFKEMYAINVFKASLSQKKKKEYYKYAVMYKRNKQFKW